MPPTQQQQQQQHKKQQQPLRMEFSPPSPILAKSLTPADGAMNGVGFHEISLRSPADQPVVLSFDGHGSISNGSLSNGGGGAKSPVEANSQVKLIESGTSSATSSSKKVPPSKCPPLLRPIWLLFSSRRFLLALVLALTIIAIGLIVSLVLVILKWAAAQRHQFEEDADFLNRDSSWRDGCERKCNAKFDVPPLLLISMDGFRADYLQRNSTPSVSRIMQCGSSAKYMSPSYPSKTFPNHYTIVTGLYPESHGIVDNHFYDEDMPDEKNFAKSSRNPAWYNGEPIWNTVTKNGKKSAIFFWPGSEVPIQGMLPTYRYQYNASLPFSKRADQVIDWLRLSETDRPAFLAMYFEQPDTAMHREGPDSDAVNSALIYVDAMINYLMQKLDNNGLLGCINLVILSDHGAQKLREDHFIAMDQFVNAKDPQVGGVFGGTIGHINFRNSASQSFIDRVLAPMSCSAGQTFRVYTRESMPKRYHYTKSGRIGEIVIDSVGGTRLFVDQRSLREHGGMEKGDHGYDNRMREMRAIFGAWGPSIKRGFDVKPFQNIELYNLFTALMQLPVSAPNNGTLGRLHSLLRSPPPIESTAVSELPECEGARLVKCGDGCHFELNYQSGSISVPSSPADASASSASSSSESAASSSVLQSPPTATTKVPVYNAQQCQYADRVVVPSELADGGPSGRLCIIRLCNATMVFNRRLRIASWVESQLAAPIPNIDHRANCTGHLVVPQLRPKTVATTTTTEASTITMMSSSATGQQISKRSKFTSSEGQQSQQPDALAADDENSHEEENHMTSDPTVGGGTMDADASEAAPWNRPGEMTGSEMPTTTATQGPMAVGATTGMPTSSSPPPFSSSSSAPNSQPQQQQKSPQQLECARLSRQTPAVGMAAAASNVENGPNTSWISLFPDNDYARYIVQGQFRVPSGFYNGPWKQVLSLIRQYVQHYKRLLMWSGPVFDHDHDGLADPITTGDNNGDEENTASSSPPPPLPPPSHIFLILLRCSNNTWHSDGRHCTQPEATKTLAFALPLVEKDLNCLFPVEYIFRHTASIRDIERLTGNEWFTDRDLYPPDLAIKLRTQLNEQLWQLELKT